MLTCIPSRGIRYSRVSMASEDVGTRPALGRDASGAHILDVDDPSELIRRGEEGRVHLGRDPAGEELADGIGDVQYHLWLHVPETGAPVRLAPHAEPGRTEGVHTACSRGSERGCECMRARAA